MNNASPIREIFSSIQGEGYLAGRRQIFIRMASCNLNCSYCDTDFAASDYCRVETEPGSLEFERIPGPIVFERILEIVKAWISAAPGAHHSISLTGGEPLLFAETLAGCLPQLARLLPIHLETNGSLVSELGRILPCLTYISMDMKLPSSTGCGELWDIHRSFLEAAAEKNISVKIVISAETSDMEIRRVCDIINGVRPDTPLFIQPLTNRDVQCGVESARLLRFQSLASSFVSDVRVIPQMHLLMGVM